MTYSFYFSWISYIPNIQLAVSPITATIHTPSPGNKPGLFRNWFIYFFKSSRMCEALCTNHRVSIGVSKAVSRSGIGTLALTRKDRVLWTSDFEMRKLLAFLIRIYIGLQNVWEEEEYLARSKNKGIEENVLLRSLKSRRLQIRGWYHHKIG